MQGLMCAIRHEGTKLKKTLLLAVIFFLALAAEIYLVVRTLSYLVIISSPKGGYVPVLFGDSIRDATTILMQGFSLWALMWVLIFLLHDRPRLAVALKLLQVALLAVPLLSPQMGLDEW